MRLRDIMRSLSAVEVTEPMPDPIALCSVCGSLRLPYADGREALCITCTTREMGESAYQLALRVEFGLSRRVVEERLEKHGPPHVSPKEWLTPKSRARRRGGW